MQDPTKSPAAGATDATPSAPVDAEGANLALLAFAKTLASGAVQGGNVATVFGAPIKLDSLTVVPVARVSVGAGGGGVRALGAAFDVVRGLLGSRKVTQRAASKSLAGGGGIGINVQPVGFIHEQDGRAVFTALDG